MENTNKLTSQEVEDLRKSLTTLGMSEEEIDSYIEKAQKGESQSEPTIEQKAEGGEGAKKDDGIEKSTTMEEDIEKCNLLKKQKEEIEKSIAALETKIGNKNGSDISKSIENDIEKSIGTRIDDIQKSIGERLDDIQKSIGERIDDISSKFTGIDEIVKGLQDEVKKIGDTPIPPKGVVTKANFFEKGIGDDINNGDPKELSITKDKDEILKSLQDVFEKETNTDARQMLSDGISDYTVNTVPTTHGIRALAYLSRKKNITLGQ